MKPWKKIFPAILWGSAVSTLALAGTAKETPQLRSLASQDRLLFRCTLDRPVESSFQVQENDGWVIVNDAFLNSGKFPVVKADLPNGDRSYRFVRGWVSPEDYVPRDFVLTIGGGNSPDFVTLGEEKIQCRYKATIDSAILNGLVQITESSPSLRALKIADSYGLCKELGFGYNYGVVALEQPLGADQWLLAIYCDMGAYQGTYQLVLWDNQQNLAKILTGEELDQERNVVTPTRLIFGVPYWDEQRGALTTFAKGRGIGDCGMLTQFFPMAGNHLHIETVRAKLACDGNPIPPDEWPVVYKAP